MTVITPEKIEEWIKEVGERPASAPIILQYISNRLRELTDRNEELLAENIALISGKRVEEYEQRLAHLEYQLELLKRQIGSNLSPEAMRGSDRAAADSTSLEDLNILIYRPEGRILSIELNPQSLIDGFNVCQIQGELLLEEEPPRLLVVSSKEEIMSIYTSGRISTFPVSRILPIKTASDGTPGIIRWNQASLPDEPRGGERLACLMPVSRLPLAEFFVQTSRRGFVKKVRTSMAQSIFSNHYIGSGVKLPLDRTFSICLGGKDDHLIVISHEGFLFRLEMTRITSSVEEAIRLGTSDHLVSAEDRLEVGRSLKTKGQAIYSAQRREKGARVVGAGSVNGEDWAAGLHQDGQIILYSMANIFASGLLPAQSQLLTFETFPSPIGKS
jgi:DNA gyrase/topoisomerase IV subunit A